MEKKQVQFIFTNFEKYMQEKGINERFISIMTGISEKHIRNVLSGKSDFRFGEVQIILKLFRALFGNESDDLCSKLFLQYQ